MSLSEIEFLPFLAIVWCLCWAGPRREGWQNTVLLGASYVFYATWNWRLLGVVLAGTAVDYAVVQGLGRAATPGRRRGLLAVSMVTGLATLACFKYALFVADAGNDLLRLLGLVPSIPLVRVAVPLGISFFTLQRLGFVLDVYWSRSPAPRSLLAFALFCCFFPQLAAGPIARGGELLTQFERPRRFDLEAVAVGAGTMLLGFALKAWAADAIGSQWVDPVFADPAGWSAGTLGLAVVSFSFQVFGDFAGYSLMAIGVSRLFGIELPENFRAPFLSQSLPELWRRWHITLNRWLFDYVLTPLTTSHGGWRCSLNAGMVLTFLASGLWHGAAWTFVLWGALHGLGMVVHARWDEAYRRLCRRDRRYVTLRTSTVYALASWATTMTFFLLTLIPFRAASLADVSTFVSGLGGGGPRTLGIGGLEGLSAVGGAAFIVVYHLSALPGSAWVWRRWQALPPAVHGIAYGVAIVVLLLLTPTVGGAFIYQQF